MKDERELNRQILGNKHKYDCHSTKSIEEEQK